MSQEFDEFERHIEKLHAAEDRSKVVVYVVDHPDHGRHLYTLAVDSESLPDRCQWLTDDAPVDKMPRAIDYVLSNHRQGCVPAKMLFEYLITAGDRSDIYAVISEGGY